MEKVMEKSKTDAHKQVGKEPGGKHKKGQNKWVPGTFRANAKGFGFVVTEEENNDIFIGGDDVNGAFDGDEVEVKVTREPAGRNREGKIMAVTKRAALRLVGLYQHNAGKNFGFVRPDNQKIGKDIYVPNARANGAVDGQKVVIDITSYGDKKNKPEGKVMEIIGYEGDPGTDIMSIVKDYNLPVEFKERVLNQAERVSLPVSDADRAGRRDLRALDTVTVDGEDAKDLDDAITLEKQGDNYRLGVHIADVTNYVQENSALDREAYERGTSVYLVDRVIPMLPQVLSNGICSLNAGEDRLALSCLMTIDENGEVIDHEIVESVINVTERMSYTGVRNILDGDAVWIERYRPLVPMFHLMEELSAIIRRHRHERGSIDFDFPETKITLDENGHPVDIKPYERNRATMIIEDFMLLANETVAEEYFWREVPFLYRVHETPDEERIHSLATFINNFGYSLHLGQQEVKPKAIQKLLTKIEGSEEEPLISRLALRSMKQAHYAPENAGHFGLAAKYYTHFTSPIRRYPDLQIHRIIKENLRGRLNAKRQEHYEKILPEVGGRCSEMERRAEDAERDTVKLKKAEYMQERVGKTYVGVISSVTRWGMYIELPNTVEGLVHVANMHDDHYDYVEERQEMVGETTGKVYKLGEHVKVAVTGADLLTRNIDFELVKKGDL